jgi:hypothetical protein
MSKTTDNVLKRAEKARSNLLNLSDFLCLTPFSAIFQLNHGNPITNTAWFRARSL